MSDPIITSVLDRISVSRVNYWVGFALDGVVSVALIVAGAAAHGLALAPVIAFGVGWLMYTFYEYALHRWAYHGPRSVMSTIHRSHHGDGSMVLGAPFFFTLAFTAIHLALAWLVVAPALAMVFAGTIQFAYVRQSLVHHLAHAWPGSWRIAPGGTFAQMRRHHMIHHHGEGNDNFGMSTRLWDHVFGTVATRVARR